MVVKNNSDDSKGTRACKPKIPAMQININAAEIKRRERLTIEGKRRDIVLYIKDCLKKGEDIEKVLKKAKIYARVLRANPESITRKSIERFAKDMGLSGNINISNKDADIER